MAERVSLAFRTVVFAISLDRDVLPDRVHRVHVVVAIRLQLVCWRHRVLLFQSRPSLGRPKFLKEQSWI